MSQVGGRSYRTREFARLAGVTVRALQYYDRMGLLTPMRSEAGARLYSESDLNALVQILALKSVGVPLKRIGALRAKGPRALAETLGTQRQVLERTKPDLERVIFAVRSVEAALTRGEEADPAALKPLMDALRSGTAASSPAPEVERPRSWTELKADWQALLDELERAPSAAGGDADAAMLDLARRWDRLMALSTDGASYARDLAPQADLLRARSWGSARNVVGGTPFDRIGPALATLAAPDPAPGTRNQSTPGADPAR